MESSYKWRFYKLYIIWEIKNIGKLFEPNEQFIRLIELRFLMFCQ